MAAGDSDLQRQLEALFLEELQDNLRVLEDGFAAIRDGSSDDTLVRDLFRAAHSLKGAAHSAGVTDAVRPCHHLEGLLVEVRDGARRMEDAMPEIADDVAALAGVAQDLRAGGGDTGPGAADRPRPDGAPATAPAATTAREDVRARVTVRRLDRLVERAGELITTGNRFHDLAEELEATSVEASRTGRAGGAGVGAIDDAGFLRRARELDRQLQTIAVEVAATAQDLRLQPVRDVTGGLDHAVRELCRTTGKDARLVVEGSDVELDRDVGDALREPLLHLVRNAVDHGIETPEERDASGKERRGTVTVSASEDGGSVLLRVRDDGAGIDVARLQARAGAADGEAAGHDDVELAFLPGLSTAETVTDVSGRGMGLDAARAAVEALGGTLHLHTSSGAGTDVEMRVPRTLAVVRVLLVDTGQGEHVALPLAGIGRLHRISEDAIEHVEGQLAVVVGDRRRPAVPLSVALALPAASSDAAAVAVEVPGEDGVLLVRRAVTELEVVLRPLPAVVDSGAGLLGAALLPTGETAVVANTAAALRNGLSMAASPPPVPSASATRTRVLLAEDTVTTRALERSILESAGYEVIVAVDGADALERLHENTVDVVVSDVDMPRLNGIELCRAIRASVHHGDVPVILVTSLASEDDRRRGLDAGANAYLVKSAFDQAALLGTLAQFV